MAKQTKTRIEMKFCLTTKMQLHDNGNHDMN